MKERKDRIDDALHATRAAVDEGIVAGGGVALVRAAAAIDKLGLEGDEAVGAEIVVNAVSLPLVTIASNAGQEGEVVSTRCAKPDDCGYNAKSGDYEDLVKADVIDGK